MSLKEFVRLVSVQKDALHARLSQNGVYVGMGDILDGGVCGAMDLAGEDDVGEGDPLRQECSLLFRYAHADVVLAEECGEHSPEPIARIHIVKPRGA